MARDGNGEDQQMLERIDLDLGRLARWLFAAAFGLIVVGLLKTTIHAPCDVVGPWISIASAVPAGLACLALLIIAIAERSAESVVAFILGIAGTGMTVFVALSWTAILCRGM
jgi:hypothetical protein